MASAKRNVLQMMAKENKSADSIVIRDAQLADLPELSRLAHRIWHEHYTPIIGEDQVRYMLALWYNLDALTEQMQEPGRFTRIVEISSEMAGYIQYGLQDEAMFIYKVYIAEEHRGKGIGKQLFDQIEHRPITLRVNRDNANSIAFYQRYGFEITGEDVESIGGGFVRDDYLMRCDH